MSLLFSLSLGKIIPLLLTLFFKYLKFSLKYFLYDSSGFSKLMVASNINLPSLTNIMFSINCPSFIKMVSFLKIVCLKQDIVLVIKSVFLQFLKIIKLSIISLFTIRDNSFLICSGKSFINCFASYFIFVLFFAFFMK